MILQKLFGYIPVFKFDKNGHRQYTCMYEDLCQ